MSVNFPTAFWKNQSEEADVVPTDVENTQITWSKYLYYGYNNPEIAEGRYLQSSGRSSADIRW